MGAAHAPCDAGEGAVRRRTLHAGFFRLHSYKAARPAPHSFLRDPYLKPTSTYPRHARYRPLSCLSACMQSPTHAFTPCRPRPASGKRQPSLVRAPDWLVKWAALVLQYVELEKRELPSFLLKLPPHLGRFTLETAAIEAQVRKRQRKGPLGGLVNTRPNYRTALQRRTPRRFITAGDNILGFYVLPSAAQPRQSNSTCYGRGPVQGFAS